MSLSTLQSYSSTQSQRPSGSVSHPTQPERPTAEPSQNHAPDREPSDPEFIIQGQPPAEENSHNQTPEGEPSSTEPGQGQSPAEGNHNQSPNQLVQAHNITHSNDCDPADGPADPERGSKCDFICLDGRYNRKGDFHIKLSTLPLDADQQEEREWAKYAIISTRQFNHDGKHIATIIEITSPHILKALEHVAPYYPDAPVITKTSVTYYSPFELLVHCFEDLNDYRDKSVDDVAKLHIGLLIRVIRLEVGATLNELEGLLSAKKITYKLAWAIFRPGTIVFTEVNDEPEQCRVHSTVYVEKDFGAVRFMRVYVEQIDFDGKYFKTRKSCIIIPGFNGVAPIASLLVYPSKFHPEHDTIVRSIVERGKKWYDIQSAAPKTMTLTATCKCVGKDNKAPKFSVSLESYP